MIFLWPCKSLLLCEWVNSFHLTVVLVSEIPEYSLTKSNALSSPLENKKKNYLYCSAFFLDITLFDSKKMVILERSAHNKLRTRPTQRSVVDLSDLHLIWCLLFRGCRRIRSNAGRFQASQLSSLTGARYSDCFVLGAAAQDLTQIGHV